MAQSNHTPNVICERCGKAFHVKPSKVAAARFCSYECRKSRVVLSCEWCGRDFETFTSRSHQQFCSPKCRSKAKTGTLPDRFDAAVPRLGPDDCWPHNGRGDTDGYGVFKFQERIIKLHRLAYELFIGEIPADMCVCHECDNPRCCNPAHLFLGTNEENIHDRHSKGRDAKGESGGMTKLTEEDVHAIRSLLGTVSDREIARRFDVSKHAIYCIRTGRTWRHLATPLPDH